MDDAKKLLLVDILAAREASSKLYKLVNEQYQSDETLMLLASVLEDATQNTLSSPVFND